MSANRSWIPYEELGAHELAYDQAGDAVSLVCGPDSVPFVFH